MLPSLEEIDTYIATTFAVYEFENNYETNYNDEIICDNETIFSLQQSNNEFNALLTLEETEEFKPFLSLEEAKKLSIGDKIDHRDTVGRYAIATIVEKDGSNLKIHYDDWDTKYDTYSDYNIELHKFAKAYSVSRRKTHRFKDIKIGDGIDLNPILRHPGWTIATIKNWDEYSEQVLVTYRKRNRYFMYWTHLDNKKEVAQVLSKYDPFVAFTLEDAKKLKVGDDIDHRNRDGKYSLARISEKNGSNLMIIYYGRILKYDGMSDYTQNLHKFAEARTISRREAHRLKDIKVGEFVDINPKFRHFGWKCGEICEKNENNGQVLVSYKVENKKYFYWTHLDNKKEVMPFLSVPVFSLVILFWLRKSDIKYGWFQGLTLITKKYFVKQMFKAMGQTHNYITRAFRVYEVCTKISKYYQIYIKNLKKQKNYGTNYNVEIISQIIFRLQKKDIKKRRRKQNNNNQNKNISEFKAHLTLEEAKQLRINDKIDYRDSIGRFILATVKQKNGSNLKIDYDGWSRKWDEYSDYTKELHRFAKVKSISQRKAHRFKHITVGNFIDINPELRHPGWKVGEIRRIDKNSGQVQIAYEMNNFNKNCNCLYWSHLDNKKEIVPFLSFTPGFLLIVAFLLRKMNIKYGWFDALSKQIKEYFLSDL